MFVKDLMLLLFFLRLIAQGNYGLRTLQTISSVFAHPKCPRKVFVPVAGNERLRKWRCEAIWAGWAWVGWSSWALQPCNATQLDQNQIGVASDQQLCLLVCYGEGFLSLLAEMRCSRNGAASKWAGWACRAGYRAFKPSKQWVECHIIGPKPD